MSLYGAYPGAAAAYPAYGGATAYGGYQQQAQFQPAGSFVAMPLQQSPRPVSSTLAIRSTPPATAAACSSSVASAMAASASSRPVLTPRSRRPGASAASGTRSRRRR